MTAASYWLLPRNTSPYYAIRLKSTKTWEVDLDCYITLAGTWGWSVSPPADITQACANWVLAIYNTQGAAAGLNSETIGDYAVSYQDQAIARGSATLLTAPPPSVAALLAPYRRLI